jgi:hypothetical protein
VPVALLRHTAAVNPDPQHRPARRRAGLIAGIAAGAVVLVGAAVAITIAATRTPDTSPAAQQQTQAAASTAAATPPAATASAANPAVLKLGAKADGPVSASTVYSWKQPVADKAPKPEQDGMEWGAADVEICAKIDGAMSRTNWRLTYADHTTIEPSSTGYRQFPAPEYPWDERDLTAGQCVRGWLTFAVPAGQKPATVQYQPRGGRYDWQVS